MPTWLFELLRELKAGHNVALGQSMGPKREWLVWGWGRQPVGSLPLGEERPEVERLLAALPPGGAVVSGRPGQSMLWEKLDPRQNSGAIWQEAALVLERPVSEAYKIWLFTSAPTAPPEVRIKTIRHLITARDAPALSGDGASPPGRWHTLDLLYPPPSPGRLIIIGLDQLAHAVADLARKCGLNVVVVGPGPLLRAGDWAGYDLCPLKDWSELESLGPGARLAFRKQDYYLITAAEASFMKPALTPFTAPQHLKLMTGREVRNRSSAALTQAAVQLVAGLLAQQ